jgi:uncharacterized protein YndB with AHSA1/START domain
MTTKSQTTESTADREIIVTRVLNAPRELVWEVWTNPEHLINWWGPRGFTNTFQEIAIKPGGIWRFIMHGPDGRDYQNKISFREVVKPERLTYTHGDDKAPEQFFTTVTFEALGETTKVTMRAVFPSAAERDFVIKEHGALEGGNQTMDRLVEQVSRVQIGESFVVTRTFNASRELVWKAFTDPEHMQQWWGPKGSKVTFAKMDFRPGGSYLYCLRMPDGMELWGKFVYREIVSPEKITYINCFSDSQGGFTRNPWNPGWPLETLSEFALVEHAGKTTLTLRWTPYNATEAERNTFNEGRPGMVGGWKGTLDRLDEFFSRNGK